MTRKEALIELTELTQEPDIEHAHVRADEILLELLRTLGYADIIEAYNRIDKWYA